MNNYTREDILRMVEEEDVGFIRLQFTDIFGTMKNIAITTSQLDKALNNEIMFDGSSIEGFARVEESDMYLYPNLNTFEIFPWRPQQGKVARLLCDVQKADGSMFESDPRYVLKKVLKEAEAEMLDYQGCGMSVMEMSHRSSVFQEIIETAEADIRELMHIPDNYKVLFLQGGASQQFAMIPMNLMKNKVADYIVTGQWAKKAAKEAEKYGEVHVVASSEDKTFSYIPDCSDLDISEDADYVYICENNTIYGTKFKELPNTKGKTLVADVSSCFLSEPVDVSKYGVIYGGVQKNVGPAGVVIAIIREDLITDDVLEGTPTMLKYKTHADAKSLYNTPPAYGIYICGKVFKWLKKQGGLEAIKERNEKKAEILYDYLDESKLFKGTVVPKDRSLMNVPFVTGDKDLDAKFVKEAKKAGFENLKGHRSVGGMRASIYNAMPIEGVEKLVEFMKAFEKENL